MEDRMQQELEIFKKLAIAKNEDFFLPGRKFELPKGSLAEVIKTKKEAESFLANLEFLSMQAQGK